MGYGEYEAGQQFPEDPVYYNADARYTHQEGWLCYPWEPAEYQGWVIGDTPFPTRQFISLFGLNEELLPD